MISNFNQILDFFKELDTITEEKIDCYSNSMLQYNITNHIQLLRSPVTFQLPQKHLERFYDAFTAAHTPSSMLAVPPTESSRQIVYKTPRMTSIVVHPVASVSHVSNSTSAAASAFELTSSEMQPNVSASVSAVEPA